MTEYQSEKAEIDQKISKKAENHRKPDKNGRNRTKSKIIIIGSRARQRIADVGFPPMVGGGPTQKTRFLLF